MDYIRFFDSGYEYYDDKNLVLFSDDKMHSHLFTYVVTDFSSFPTLFRQYISQKVNILTLDVTNKKGSEKTINELQKILISAHPYYKFNYKKVIINALGDFFNKHLLYLIFNVGAIPLNITLQEEWYCTRFRRLIPSFLTKANNYPEDLFPINFYFKYKASLDEMGYGNEVIEESFIENVSSKMPIGFSEELRLQKNVHNLLYFILDENAKDINTLTIPQRIWLYDTIFHQSSHSRLEMDMEPKIIFHSADPYSAKLGFDSGIKLSNKKLYMLHKLNITKLENNKLHKSQKNIFNSAIEYASTINPKIYEEYEISRLSELLYIEIINMIRSNIKIRKCVYCGKYFIPNNRNRKSCSDTCSKIIKKEQRRQIFERDDAARTSKNVIDKGRHWLNNNYIQPEGFKELKKQAIAFREECYNEKNAKKRKEKIKDFQNWAKSLTPARFKARKSQ